MRQPAAPGCQGPPSRRLCPRHPDRFLCPPLFHTRWRKKLKIFHFSVFQSGKMGDEEFPPGKLEENIRRRPKSLSSRSIFLLLHYHLMHIICPVSLSYRFILLIYLGIQKCRVLHRGESEICKLEVLKWRENTFYVTHLKWCLRMVCKTYQNCVCPLNA